VRQIIGPVTAVAALVAAAFPAPTLRAQTAAESVAQGIEAYGALEYDAAAALLERGLSVQGPDALPLEARPQAYVYLGATELFRRRRPAAEAAFREALRADPRHRPDPLVFPPTVANVFDAVRRTTAYVAIEVPADTSVILGREYYEIRLYASALHNITVQVLRHDERELRSLYSGPIADSLVVRWEGLDDQGRPPAEGRVLIQVTSQRPSGRHRLLHLPLRTTTATRDTLAHPLPPADSLYLPEREPKGPGLRALGAGLAGAALSLALPAVVATDGASAPSRYLVAMSLTAAGVLGYIAARPGRPIPDNIVTNQIMRDGWRRERDAVVVENEARRRDLLVRFRAEDVIEIDPGGP